MLWARWLIYGIPTALVLLTWWSANQAADGRRFQRNDIVIASSEGVLPSLNPFLPVSEVDRQISSLVHEPLLRIGEDGRIIAALAKQWNWTQRTSFWFANELFAKNAAAKLKKLTPEQWAQWHLSSAEAVGTEVRLQLSRAGAEGPTAVLQNISEFGPLPVETVRIELKEEAKSHHAFFLQNAVEGSQVKTVWFDGPQAYELSISGETVRFYEELELYYRNHPDLQAKITPLGKTPMLNRPQLEMVLREGAAFHDGTPVTGADVEATANLVVSQPWPVPSRQALRLVASWDSSAPGYVRITFRELYGPAIMAFVDFAVLPAKWIAAHADAISAGRPVFATQPPLGAGLCSLESTTAGSIFLVHKAGAESTRLQFLLDQPSAAVRMGFTMRAVDIFWPGPSSVQALNLEKQVTLASTTPRSRLMVMWNCRRPALQDVRTRAALGLAVDRPAMMQELLGGRGEIRDGIFQPDLWFSNDMTPKPFDPDLARLSLYEAGWIKNTEGMLMRGGQPLQLDLLTVSNNPERLKLAKKLQKAWEQIGAAVTVTEVAWEELLDRRLPLRQFDAALIGVDFETTWDQLPFWSSGQTKRGLNFSGFADAGLDTLLRALRDEFDPERVPSLANEVEERIVNGHPYLPLFSGGSTVALREGAQPGINGYIDRARFSLRQMLMETVRKPNLP